MDKAIHPTDDELRDLERSIRAAIGTFLQDHGDRAIENLIRCRTVWGMPDFLQPGRAAALPGEDDLLRAAVVFLHATVEDTLRTVLIAFLQPDFRPLHEFISSGRMLAEGGIPERLMPDSIEARFKRTVRQYTFNRRKDIEKWMRKLGVDPAKLDQRTMRTIGALMRRRHQIAHHGDRDDTGALKAITTAELQDWQTASETFVREFLQQVGTELVSKRVYEHTILVKLLNQPVGKPMNQSKNADD